jgi:uncharacterized membrane protein YvbJ
MAENFCSNCGKPLLQDDKFCSACGKSTVKTAPSAPSAPAAQKAYGLDTLVMWAAVILILVALVWWLFTLGVI